MTVLAELIAPAASSYRPHHRFGKSCPARQESPRPEHRRTPKRQSLQASDIGPGFALL